MVPVITTAEIGRPAAEVLACATVPTRFPEWQKGVVDGHMDGQAVGAKCVTTRRIGGASRPSTSELTAIDPPRTWSVRGTDGPIRAAVDVLASTLVTSVTGVATFTVLSLSHHGPVAPDWPTGLALGLGGLGGAYTGARLQARMPDTAIRRIVVILVIVTGGRYQWSGLG